MSEETDEERELREVLGQAPKLNRDLRMKKFLPWHLPRKQFIRRKQWCASLEVLVSERRKQAGGMALEIRYLGLPGEELLDIRAFHEVCSRQGAVLRFLGFNTEAARSTEIRISTTEVLDLPNIDRVHSRVEADRFESVSTHKTESGRRFREHGPYDVVNLDLCDSVAGDPPKNVNGTLQAVRTVIDYQLNARTGAWLLFLTTRVGADYVDAAVFERLVACVLQNMCVSEDFANEVQSEFSGLTREGLEAISSSPSVEHQLGVRLFTLGFCKWVLMLRGNREWLVTLESAYGYTVKEHRPDLVSLALRFVYRPKPVLDPLRLTVDPKGAPAHSLAEVELARKMVKGVSRAADLDLRLAAQPALMEEMIAEACELLVQAGHDPVAYREWAKTATATRAASGG